MDRVKLSDGWNNIWFHFDKDTLLVSPTMIPTRIHDPGTSAPIGIAHSVISLGYRAGLELVEYMNELYEAAGVQRDCEDEETDNPKDQLGS